MRAAVCDAPELQSFDLIGNDNGGHRSDTATRNALRPRTRSRSKIARTGSARTSRRIIARLPVDGFGVER
jgi:hypothetical protein